MSGAAARTAPADAAIEPIIRLRMPDITPATLPEDPQLMWIPVAKLRINRAYQRDLTRKSVTLIRQMVAGFDWARMKALSVLKLGGGLYEVLDGQHTAIAAASHGGIDSLPCLVCSERPAADAAAAFVDLNTQRVNLSKTQIFFAQVTAGDEAAVDVATGVRLGGDVMVCKLRAKLKRFGVEILTRWGLGYELTPESRALVREATRPAA